MRSPSGEFLGVRFCSRGEPFALGRLLRQRRKTQSGFNLIEVSLAIAICSIGLIALMGLIPTGTEASRRAADDTLVASLGSDFLQCRRISPYANTTYFPNGGPALTNRPTSPVPMTLDAMGNQATDINGNPNNYYTGPYFYVTYSVMDHPQFGSAPNIARLLVVIEWPANAPVAMRSRRCFVSDYTRMK